MRQVYNANGNVAWIGNSAPIPDGYSLDFNHFKREVTHGKVQGQGPEKIITDDIKEAILSSDKPNGPLAKELGLHWKQVDKIRREAGQ